MEDLPDTSTRCSKRKATNSSANREDHYRTSDAIDQSPSKVACEGSRDNIEEIHPITKQSRALEATAASIWRPELSLIKAIKGDGKFIPQVVKCWVERYEKDANRAMAELLTMLFQACGAKYYHQGESLENVDDVVCDLVQLAIRGEVEVYQSSERKEFNNFKDNLVSFWDNLVVECQNGPLFDKVLFNKCMDYIIALTRTPPRVYRQVASLMGFQLVTSFISVAKTLGTQRETTQLNAEKKKQIEGPRVESLNKRLWTTDENITDLEAMMLKIFTKLFKLNIYRDVDPAIRMSTMQYLGVWILSYPSVFLKAEYLKYLGWELNDRSADVRKACVLALQNLYDVVDDVRCLNLFTEKYSERMIELSDDIDVSVAVCAIGLVKQLLRRQLLPDAVLHRLYHLLIADPPEIRHATGALVYDHLIAKKFNSTQSGSNVSDSESSEVHLRRMLEILRDFSADPIFSIYVIDDVWEYMKAMKDWKCIISILLGDSLPELSDEDETNLIRLLFASAKKAVGERIVPASDNRKQYYNESQKEVLENNRRDLTNAMMEKYPLLLHKFMADKAKVCSLVEIIVYMNVELCSLKIQEQNFKTVLQLIKEVFFKHGEKDALRSCVKSFKFCSTESQGDLPDFVRNNLKGVEDELIAKLKSAIKGDDDDNYTLLVNLKRLYELQLSNAVPMESLYNDILMILRNRNSRNLDEEVVGFLLHNMYLHLAWSLHSVIYSETVSDASLSSLLLKRNTLFTKLEYFFDNCSSVEEWSELGNQLACRVCAIFAEMWCLFRMTNFSSTKIEKLGYCPEAHVLQKFWKLCEQQLNVSDKDVNEEYGVIIAAAKLIATDAVPKEYLGPEIISHFVLHGTNVSEIVKRLITDLNKIDDGMLTIFLEAMKRAYNRHLGELSRSNNKSLTDKSFLECKELAALLSGTFVGATRNKYRTDILRFVKEGIEYAFVDAPKQLSFLEGAVLHFVSRLPTSDVLGILKDAQKRSENMNTDDDPSGWCPYNSFVKSLHDECAKNEGIQGIIVPVL